MYSQVETFYELCQSGEHVVLILSLRRKGGLALMRTRQGVPSQGSRVRCP